MLPWTSDNRREGLTSLAGFFFGRLRRWQISTLPAWLREDVTYHHCHASADDLKRRVAGFEARINRDPYEIADRLWVRDQLDPDKENYGSQTRHGLDARTAQRPFN